MDKATLLAELDAFIEDNWENVIADLDKLVHIESIEELDKTAPNAPFGPGPKAALTEALNIASSMGFETHDAEGYIGFADFPGESDTQIGIIGHMDVVPAGKGWHFPEYAVTRKEGYLLGRGVLDDKGPSIVALYAMKFWKDRLDAEGKRFPYTIRFLFGANEETGMADVAYYHEHYADPAFLFTPDAEYPVCYGEKGGFDATITGPVYANGSIVDFEGGSATNAVPGFAHVVVKGNIEEMPPAEGLTFTEDGTDLVRIDATGKSAHASTPENGVNAIALLVNYILEQDLCTAEERPFIEFLQKLLNHTDGSGVGIKSEDEFFGPLTVIGGTIKMEDGHIVQTLDSRFPTSITPEEITANITALTEPLGATFENTLLMEPFLVKPDTPQIQALLTAYNDVTGEGAKPFTMGGGTYAREFTSGASFGPEKPWIEAPEWAGLMHGPDEAVSEDLLKESLKIYALALQNLMELKL